MSSRKPEVLDRTLVAESRMFRVECVHLRFSNGEERHYEYIQGQAPSSIMVVPLLDSETILLVREYGAGVDDYTLGFPKGALEAGEDELVAANRELMEEVGYGARRLRFLKRITASPSYVRSAMDVILAEDLYPQREEGDEPEPLEVVPWKLSNIPALLEHPEFHEGRSIAALLLLQNSLK